MQLFDSLSAFSDQYSHFIIDLWGVLHDGQAPYPHAIEALEKLRAQDKQILLLSNAPRRAYKAEQRMTELGFARKLYDYIVTSGEVTYQWLKQGNFNHPIVQSTSHRYYYIGPPKDEDILDGLDYERVTEVKDADFVLVTGFDNFGDAFETKLPEAQACLETSLPMVCANPDKKVVRQTGEIMLCAGLIAEWYETQGGQVTSFGKPHQATYEHCLELLGVDHHSVCAIGDNLDTDIAGANRMGIYSVLVTGGILADELGIGDNETPDQHVLENLCNLSHTHPKAILPVFTW